MALQYLRSLQALDLVLQTGSLKAAAETLMITPAAVGQRIKALEDYLGIELVMRGRSGLRPSPELGEAEAHLRAGFAELSMAAEKLELQKVNEIHVAADSDWVELWLMRRLDTFRKRFPNIKFCINGEGDVPGKFGRTDCEIMFGPADGSDAWVVLFDDLLAPLGTIENKLRIERKPDPDARLDGFPLLHLDFYRNDPAAVSWPEWIADYGYRTDPADRGIRFQRIGPALEAVLSDAGFVITGVALIREMIEAEEVALPFPEIPPKATTYSFCAKFRASSMSKPAVRAFRTWLEQEGDKTREWLTEFKLSR